MLSIFGGVSEVPALFLIFSIRNWNSSFLSAKYLTWFGESDAFIKLVAGDSDSGVWNSGFYDLFCFFVFSLGEW
jgi:hypothetical protein